MDERWLKALRAKNNPVKGMRGGVHGGKSHALDEQMSVGKSAARGASQPSKRHTQPFKATGHKGGISRQGA
ncbi:hypothetical protein EHS19_09705 [Bifidobacterium jacchi]|uniref:Uncharacterized protein n=2 Tax=Bifidobacterium jacchi TaxID=2490545 RepID=A0A5N5RE78_9BIFI|nr:hypothetical protein EHS19_09705 [Bifidobacterium jacchi]